MTSAETLETPETIVDQYYAGLPNDDGGAEEDGSPRIRVAQFDESSDHTRPRIEMGTDIHRVVDDAIAALAFDENVYTKDGAIVRVIYETVSGCGIRVATAKKMHTASILDTLTKVADWFRMDPKSEEWVKCTPPHVVVLAVENRMTWPALRPLVSIITSPSLRPDGTILQEPGYDPQTGCLFFPSCIFPTVDDDPTLEDAREAMALLEEPLFDFPFAGPADKAAAIASIITLACRTAIQGCTPAFITTARTPGTGKTLQTDVASAIVCGRVSAKMSYPPDDIELEKVLASYAICGTQVVNFDNVKRDFGGGPLDRCLTASDTVDLRVLGKSVISTLPWRTVIVASGNNVALTGDTSRRVLVIWIESELEKPEERTGFKHPELIDWVLENRAALAVAPIVIMRAWFVAGRPDMGCRPWGGFDAWSSIIPPAMVFAGAVDPMGARAEAAGIEDTEKVALAGILDGWARLAGQKGMSVKEALAVLYPSRPMGPDYPPDGFDALRDALESIVTTQPGRAPSAQRIGLTLKQYKRRVIGGRMLDSIMTHGKVMKWVVVERKNEATTTDVSLPDSEP